MKKTLLALTAFTAGFVVHGQIIVTGSHMVEIGDVVTQAHDTLPSVSVGSAGTNQTYNMSGLAGHDTSVLTFTNPNWTPQGASFPLANLCALTKSGADTTYVYMNKASSLDLAGIYGDLGFGPMAIANDDPETILHFALNYNDAYLDTSVIDETVDGGSLPPPYNSMDSARLVRTHYRDHLVDGWGTIQTPMGTFDALRQRTISIEVTEIWVLPPPPFDTWSQQSTTTDTVYRFTFFTDDPLAKFPVVEMETDDQDNPISATWLLTTPTATSIPEKPSIELSAYPNPVADVLNVKHSGSIEAFTITDLTGKVVGQYSGPQTNTIGVESLKSGIYFLTAQKGNDQKTIKFVKR